MVLLQTSDGVLLTLPDEHAVFFPTLVTAMSAGQSADVVPLYRVPEREMAWLVAFVEAFASQIVAPWTSQHYQDFVMENGLDFNVFMYFELCLNEPEQWLPMLQALDYLGGGCVYTWLLFYVKGRFRGQTITADFAP